MPTVPIDVLDAGRAEFTRKHPVTGKDYVFATSEVLPDGGEVHVDFEPDGDGAREVRRRVFKRPNGPGTEPAELVLDTAPERGS